jgi:type IV pilus assembly protein PilP
MIRRNSRMAAILLLSVWVAAAGCKKENNVPPSSPAPAKPAQPAQPVIQKQSTTAKGNITLAVQGKQSSARQAPAAVNLGDFSSRKDPFKPFVTIGPTASAKPAVAKGGDSLPIQSYDVNKFKLTGIITGLTDNRALLVDPLGKAYVVKTGMLLGNNNGRVSRISATSVEVLEYFKDDNSQLRKRTVRLTLPQKK